MKCSGYKFHTYLNDDEKRKCYILKGLDAAFNIIEIKEELERASFGKFDILPFSTCWQRANPDKSHRVFYKILVKYDFNEKT